MAHSGDSIVWVRVRVLIMIIREYVPRSMVQMFHLVLLLSHGWFMLLNLRLPPWCLSSAEVCFSPWLQYYFVISVCLNVRQGKRKWRGSSNNFTVFVVLWAMARTPNRGNQGEVVRGLLLTFLSSVFLSVQSFGRWSSLHVFVLSFVPWHDTSQMSTDSVQSKVC